VLEVVKFTLEVINAGIFVGQLLLHDPHDQLDALQFAHLLLQLPQFVAVPLPLLRDVLVPPLALDAGSGGDEVDALVVKGVLVPARLLGQGEGIDLQH
jgi:hypothetical protein